MSLLTRLCLCFCIIFSSSTFTFGCSAFLIQDDNHTLFGRNYDWNRLTKPLISINRRDIAKKAIPFFITTKSAEWSSKYGSVTFCKGDTALPSDGMNEKGLVIAILATPPTKIIEDDDRLGVGMLEWIQYMLDTCATIQDVVNADKKVRLASTGLLQHYFISDRNGDSALVEFHEGKTVFYRDQSLPVKVATNSFYDESIEALQSGKEYLKNDKDSLARFVNLSKSVDNCTAKTIDEKINCAFDMLKMVSRHSEKSKTEWSVVYNIKEGRIDFKTFDSNNVCTIDLKQIDFSHDAERKLMRLNQKKNGNVLPLFEPWTASVNYDSILRAIDSIPKKLESERKGLKLYLEQFK